MTVRRRKRTADVLVVDPAVVEAEEEVAAADVEDHYAISVKAMAIWPETAPPPIDANKLVSSEWQ